MGGVEVTGRYLLTDPLCADDAAACAAMNHPDAEAAMRRYRNVYHSHACPICGGCAAQFSRIKHVGCTLPDPAVTVVGTDPADSVVVPLPPCWFCPHLGFYPPWVSVKERRADLVGKNRLGR